MNATKCQVNYADHESARQKMRCIPIVCAGRFECWDVRYLLYLGTLTSQAYPYL